MAQIKDAIYKVHNGIDFDTIHLETKASQVMMPDGSTVQDRIGNVAEIKLLKDLHQSLTNGTPTPLTWHYKYYNKNFSHSAGGSKIATIYPGNYLIIANVFFSNISDTGLRKVSLNVNGSAEGMSYTDRNANPVKGYPAIITLATEIKLKANDYIEIIGQQNSGTALNVLKYSNISIRRVGE